MEKRNPILVYFLGWLTGSLYWFYWASKVMTAINQLSGRNIYNQKKIWRIVMVFFVWDIFLFSQIPQGGLILFYLVFAQHFGWMVFIFYSIYHFGLKIKEIENKENATATTSPLKGMLFMFLNFAGIPYIQRHLNRLLVSPSNAD